MSWGPIAANKYEKFVDYFNRANFLKLLLSADVLFREYSNKKGTKRIHMGHYL